MKRRPALRPCGRETPPAAGGRRVHRRDRRDRCVDGVDYLVGFLDRVGRNGRKSLLKVPGAAGHRRSQLPP